ncbi:MgtC/SapB family protein [Gloeocapsopsis dulcis]|uniref:MgtC/SapB family protein n=1 Tax=Gloeocapsopsis dulcis TaxID=2859516 RepID=UPI000CF69613|nr:MgtC/SapB family protein [Gloeocapsopsis dulcis]WNN90277.1 MgtC/SapB family protein [Gloeocapsopsis dulcis]
MTSTYFVSPSDIPSVVFRICIALIVGAIIGLERQLRNKPAGLRTHMLVSFGSALFVLIPLQMGVHSDSPDAISRVIQGVAAGIGFLGAGEILRATRDRDGELADIRGLTSAAAIWVSAALGVVSGCGLWQLSLISAILGLLVLSVFKQIERRIG